MIEGQGVYEYCWSPLLCGGAYRSGISAQLRYANQAPGAHDHLPRRDTVPEEGLLSTPVLTTLGDPQTSEEEEVAQQAALTVWQIFYFYFNWQFD